jgi:hypothetical protein
MAQALSHPADICIRVLPDKTPVVSTAIGTLEQATLETPHTLGPVLVLLPSWPKALYPQQYGLPEAIEQTVPPPADICVTVPDIAIAALTGTDVLEVELLPTWPSLLYPQQ